MDNKCANKDISELTNEALSRLDETMKVFNDMKASKEIESKEVEAKEQQGKTIRLNRLDRFLNLRSNIENWILNVDFKDFAEEIQSMVIGQPAVIEVIANVYNYLDNIALCNNDINNNMIIAAPSGCGKTQTYRALSKYFAKHIPELIIYTFDMTSLTPAGYKGVEPSDILRPFFNAGLSDAIGIVFLDEFDKKLSPSTTSSGENVNFEVQSSILTLIEGQLVQNKQGQYIDTSRIMFVGLGSFDYFRENRENIKAEVGFNRESISEEVDHFADITRENIIEVGGTNELIGRFPYIVNYKKLDEDSVLEIIRSISAKISDSFSLGKLILRPDFVNELIEIANGKFGCRLLDSLVRDLTLKAYSRALSDKNKSDVLEIYIENSKESVYCWREYTKEEKEELNEKMETVHIDDLLRAAF